MFRSKTISYQVANNSTDKNDYVSYPQTNNYETTMDDYYFKTMGRRTPETWKSMNISYLYFTLILFKWQFELFYRVP